MNKHLNVNSQLLESDGKGGFLDDHIRVLYDEDEKVCSWYAQDAQESGNQINVCFVQDDETPIPPCLLTIGPQFSGVHSGYHKDGNGERVWMRTGDAYPQAPPKKKVRIATSTPVLIVSSFSHPQPASITTLKRATKPVLLRVQSGNVMCVVIQNFMPFILARKSRLPA